MSGHQSTRWFWHDWAGDQAVRRLTVAERGLWFDLLTLAAIGNPTGYVCDERGEPVPVEQIARFANCSEGEAENLIDGILAKGVASRDRTGRLFNRRMVRDVELSVKRRRAGQPGAAATKLKWQALSGLPGDLPGGLPRQNGRVPLPKRNRNTSDDAAREGTREPAAAAASPHVTSELAETMARKGWTR
jgi:hypothetical protein